MNPPRIIVEPSGPTPGRIFLGITIAVFSMLLVLPLLVIVAVAALACVIVFGTWWAVATVVMRAATLLGRDGEGRRNVRVRR